jgi:hypothetical protein
MRLPVPRSEDDHRQSPREQLRLDLKRAASTGDFNGSWISLMLLAPLALNSAVVFGYYTGRVAGLMVEVNSQRLCEDDGANVMLHIVGFVPLGAALVTTGTIAGGSAVLGVGGISQIAGLGKIRHGYKRRLVKKAYRAGLLRGLGKGLLIGGGIGVGAYGAILICATATTGELGWDGWTWPAVLAGLAYASASVVSGAILFGVGSGWYASILKRTAVAPLVIPESHARGLAVVIRL